MQRTSILLLALLVSILVSVSACKKESDPCAVSLFVNDSTATISCPWGRRDEDSILIYTGRPVQTLYPGTDYEMEMRIKMQVGEQILDTATGGRFAGASIKLYKDFWTLLDSLEYSMYGSEAFGKITVTMVDTVTKHISGKFEGVLCNKDSLEDKIRVSIPGFTARYQ